MKEFRLAVTYPAYVIVGMLIYFSVSPTLSGEMAFKSLLLSISFGIWGIILVQEKLEPFRLDWQKARGDILSDALQSAVVFPLISEFIYKSFNFILKRPLKPFWPHTYPAPVQLVMILVIAELAHYWYHRISHRKKWLWRFHTIHHGALRVYSLNSARFHVVDIFFNMVAYLAPLSLFGVSDEVFYAFLTINGITGLLEHANIKFRAGLLNYVFNTAELHRWHHSEVSKESQSNFGKVLTIWDVVFNTHLYDEAREVARVGIGKRKEVPPTFIAQTLYPFEVSKEQKEKKKMSEQELAELAIRAREAGSVVDVRGEV
jgi:sterol desaturase/sphingolipid hydroxylase (fatty acid hydroxylase superfamily)